MIFQANEIQKQNGVPRIISEKANIKPKLARRDKQGHYILIKGKVCQEDLMIVNMYTTNVCC
jgi:hypothetical protein